MEQGLPGLSNEVLVLGLPFRSLKGAMYSNQLDPTPWYTDEAALWGFEALLRPLLTGTPAFCSPGAEFQQPDVQTEGRTWRPRVRSEISCS